jgi:hypothetical protein
VEQLSEIQLSIRILAVDLHRATIASLRPCEITRLKAEIAEIIVVYGNARASLDRLFDEPDTFFRKALLPLQHTKQMQRIRMRRHMFHNAEVDTFSSRQITLLVELNPLRHQFIYVLPT